MTALTVLCALFLEAVIVSFLKLELILRYEGGTPDYTFGVGPFCIHRSSRRHPKGDNIAQPPEQPGHGQAKLKAGYAVLCKLLGTMKTDRLCIHVTAASPDPAEAAGMYGMAGLAMEGLERIGNIKDCDLRADVDFDRRKPVVTGELRVSLRVSQLAYFQILYLYRLTEQLRKLERKRENDV